MVKKAWLAALGCRAINARTDDQQELTETYMNWKKYLISLSDADYQSDLALKGIPTEIK